MVCADARLYVFFGSLVSQPRRMSINRLAQPFGSGYFFRTSSSWERTPGNSSFRSNIDFQLIKSLSTSTASSLAPAVSRWVAGTQLKGPKIEFKGNFASIFDHKLYAGSHSQTLAISWGSLTVPTVPCTTAGKRANSEGSSMELSIWTCASIKPGRIKCGNFSVGKINSEMDRIFRFPSKFPLEISFRRKYLLYFPNGMAHVQIICPKIDQISKPARTIHSGYSHIIVIKK